MKYVQAAGKWVSLKFICHLLYLGVVLIRRTSTITYEGPTHLLSRSAGRRVILAFWHRDLALMSTFWKISSVHVLTTLSTRGMMLGSVARKLGHRVTLIPEGNRTRYVGHVNQVLETAKGPVVIVVDGPLGPDHKVKHNVLKWARDHGRTIIPLGVTVARYREIQKRWDRLRIPGTFNKAHIRVGSPVIIPPGATTRELTSYRGNLEEQLVLLEQSSAEIP
ncbi:MAG: lysophospholipid acyltransferase family protein [Fidelibacterota bacterium]